MIQEVSRHCSRSGPVDVGFMEDKVTLGPPDSSGGVILVGENRGPVSRRSSIQTGSTPRSPRTNNNTILRN